MYSQRGYSWSFYWLLDVVATVTIFPDFLPIVLPRNDGEGSLGATDAFRAAKSARVGTKIARLVRVLRIIRIIKLFINM